jgi:putative heme-binding domain-containing protein
VENLVAALRSDTMLWRLHAQRLLVERGGKDAVPALLKLAADPKVDEIGLNTGVIHALWTLHGLGALDGSDPQATEVAAAALRHTSPGVRRNAALVLPRTAQGTEILLSSGVWKESNLQVRLAGLLALAEMPASAQAGAKLVSAISDPVNLTDRWLANALTSAAAAHDAFFLEAAARHAWPDVPHSEALGVINRVTEHYGRGLPIAAIGGLLRALPATHPQVSGAVIAGLARGWHQDKRLNLDSASDAVLADLLPKLPKANRGQLVALAARWGSKALEKHAAAIAETFLTQVRDEKAADRARVEAAAQLIDFRKADAKAAQQLLDLLTPRSSPELARGLLEAVGRSEAPAVGTTIVECLPGLTPAVRATAIGVLLARAGWSEALLEAIEKDAVRLSELSLDQKQALSNHPNGAVSERARKLLARGDGLPNKDREKVISELLPVIRKAGDAVAGKLVFKNQCAKCHVHSGEGNKIGPDLTGMAVHTKEHLLSDIMDPSRSVEGNFRQYTVTTKAGRVLTALLASETKTTYELLDAENKLHTVLREDVEEFQASNKSLMPEGFEKQISQADLVNLLEFLTQRGKFLPLPLDKAATAVSTKGMFHFEGAAVERLVFDDWSPKTFDGVPFYLIDPRGGRVKNAVVLYGPQGELCKAMPKVVSIPCNSPAKTIHLLGGVSGWGWPFGEKGSVSMVVRLHYTDGKTEDHPLRNGIHLADYIRVVDVPESKLAFKLAGRQLRYLRVTPGSKAVIKDIEFLKGPDNTAPVVMAITLESPSS